MYILHEIQVAGKNASNDGKDRLGRETSRERQYRGLNLLGNAVTH